MMAIDLEKALLDPESAFDQPEDVPRAVELTKGQKIEILLRWEYNASEEAVALEEGMPGDETDLLRRVLVSLGQLTDPLDLDKASPTKQHGLSRNAIKTTE